jgi:hypothetical protein
LVKGAPSVTEVARAEESDARLQHENPLAEYPAHRIFQLVARILDNNFGVRQEKRWAFELF